MFEAHRLPWTSPRELPLDRLPAGRAALSLMRVLAGNFSPGEVLEVCASPWLNVSAEPLSISQMVPLSRRLGAGARAGDWEKLTKAKLDGVERETARRVWESVQRLLRLGGKFPASAPWDDLVNCLLKTIEEVVRPERAGSSEETGQALEAWVAAVEHLRWLGKVEASATAEAFWRAVFRSCEQARVSLYDRLGGVSLIDAMDGRGFSARAVFLIDLNEGAFPMKVREDPFLRDPARRVLNEVLGFKIQQKGREGLEEERLLFHLCLTQAWDRLYLIWRAHDHRGRPALPSGFLEDLAAVMSPEGTLDSLVEPGGPEPAGDGRLRFVLPPAVRARFEAGVRTVTELEREGELTGRDGILPAPPALPERFQVTRLRDLARCPFRVHAQVVLGLKSPQGPRSPWEPEARVLGMVVHDAVEASVKELAARWQEVTADEISGVVRRQIPRCFSSRLPELTRFPVLQRSLEEEWGALITDLLYQDVRWCRSSGLAPERYEHQAQREIERDGLRLLLRGRVDRIDRGDQAVRIVDYKSHAGREEIRPNLVFTPDFFQLALYRELLGEAKANAQLSVLHLGPGMSKAVALNADRETAERFGELSEQLSRSLLKLLSGGEAFPLPDAIGKPRKGWEAGCKICDFNLLCRKDHGPTQARLKGAALVRDFQDRLAAIIQGAT